MNSTQLMEKVAEVAPEKYNFIVKTAEEVKQSPFRDEIVKELNDIFEKTAVAWGQMGQSLGQGAMQVGKGVAMTAAGGIALALAGDAYDALRRGITKGRNYKRMMSANPDLREKPANQVQSIFATLHRFNPEFASDPVVSGSFVRNHVDLAGEGAGAVGLDSLKNLVDAKKNLTEMRSKNFPQMGKFETQDPEMDQLQKWKLHKEIGPNALPPPAKP